MSIARNPVRRNVPGYQPPTCRAPLPPRPAVPRPTGDGRPRLVLLLMGTCYHIEPLPRAPGDEAPKVFRLEKGGAEGQVYDVAETAEGAECTCADFEYRHRGVLTEGCKHIKALRSFGLIG